MQGPLSLQNSVIIFTYCEFACKSLLTYLFLNKFQFFFLHETMLFLKYIQTRFNHIINILYLDFSLQCS